MTGLPISEKLHALIEAAHSEISLPESRPDQIGFGASLSSASSHVTAEFAADGTVSVFHSIERSSEFAWEAWLPDREVGERFLAYEAGRQYRNALSLPRLVIPKDPPPGYAAAPGTKFHHSVGIVIDGRFFGEGRRVSAAFTAWVIRGTLDEIIETYTSVDGTPLLPQAGSPTS